LGGEQLVWTYYRKELERKNGITGANQEKIGFCFKGHSPIWIEARIRG